MIPTSTARYATTFGRRAGYASMPLTALRTLDPVVLVPRITDARSLTRMILLPRRTVGYTFSTVGRHAYMIVRLLPPHALVMIATWVTPQRVPSHYNC